MRQVKRVKLSVKWQVISGLMILLAAGVFVFFLSAPGKYVTRQTMHFIELVREKGNFVLQNVQIEGLNRTTKADIISVLDVEQGMDIFAVDLSEIQTQIATLPWVNEVIVERHLPNALYIRIKEKTPIAVWQNKKKYFPLDSDGKVIADNQTKLTEPLLLVVGPDAPALTPELIAQLNQYPEISAVVKSAVRVGGRRWDLVLFDLENGTTVSLPESDMDVALERLSRADREHQLLSKEFKVIDLRLENRLMVRLSDNDIKKKGTKK